MSEEHSRYDIALARQAWEQGELIPENITLALDSRGAYGPEVDVECGGEEPMVDEWEAGTGYPSWPQFLKLAEYTHYPLAFFFHRRPSGPEVAFLCSGGKVTIVRENADGVKTYNEEQETIICDECGHGVRHGEVTVVEEKRVLEFDKLAIKRRVSDV